MKFKLFLSISIAAIVVSPLMFVSMPGSSGDEFGKDIVIPPDMEVAEPLDDRIGLESIAATDEDGQALIDCFSREEPAAESQTISVDMPVLNEFAGPNRGILMRHLATSAGWQLSEEKGKVYAYRRFVINGRWQNSLNGYYISPFFGITGDRSFQFRIIIAPDGPVMHRPWSQKTSANIEDKNIHLKVAEDRGPGEKLESYLVLESDGAAVEIFETSRGFARTFTRLALKQIEDELTAVLESDFIKQKGFDFSLIPKASIKNGESELSIVNGMQGGIYLVYAYINPGEEGFCYLKVFEATRNTPLSTNRIPERSMKRTGWSNNPEQKFFYNSQITVYEGDWGVYYPARFEFWFVPDAGGRERKLIEKIFKIEGWQR